MRYGQQEGHSPRPPTPAGPRAQSHRDRSRRAFPVLSVGLGFCFPLLSVIERELSLTALSGASGRCPRSHRRTHSAVMDLRAPVLRALEAAGVSTPPEPLVALLRGHMSSAAISQTIASHTKARVQERAADAHVDESFALFYV